MEWSASLSSFYPHCAQSQPDYLLIFSPSSYVQKKEKRKLSKQKPNKKGTGNDGLYHHAYGHETKCRPTIVEDLNISSPNYERKKKKNGGKEITPEL